MTLILLEALGALALLVLIVWWTMFAGRDRGERRDASLGGERRDAPLGGERRDAPLGGERRDAPLGGERRDDEGEEMPRR